MVQGNKDMSIIDLGHIARTLLAKKKAFYIMWPIVFALSCLWILPEPRYYTSDISLAPEAAGEEIAGGLAGIASNFGINLGGGGNDAIYPLLYPDVFDSNEFIVGLYNIQVTTEDKSLTTDYYTYLAKHQKKNWLTQPFIDFKYYLSNMLSGEGSSAPGTGKGIDPFSMSKFDYELTKDVKKKIKCSVDKKTEVISISVEDQDPLICATLARSVSERLQAFITDYRTSKARFDMNHYQHLTDSAKLEYRSAVNEYARFCDSNQDIILQSQQSRRDELENEMQMCYNTYQAMKTQFEAMKVKVQERTPAFTILKSATVPIKPTGPKRMIFVLGMLLFSTFVLSFWLVRKEIQR